MTVKVDPSQAFFKNYVKMVDGKQCLVLPSEESFAFFKKFCEERDICDDANPHIEWLLSTLFGLTRYKVEGKAFALSEIQMSIMAKSKADAKRKFQEALRYVSTTSLESARLDTDDNGKYTVKDALDKIEIEEDSSM